jgi:4-carboxymuconolactone decarboxylase
VYLYPIRASQRLYPIVGHVTAGLTLFPGWFGKPGRIRGALNVGCARDEILEIILQMAVYAGFPAALEAVKTAASVFGEKQ